ncbi:16S rRNA (guanine(527)-N(7))-methyltransferase RsmG [Nitrospira sp. Nam74]
MEQALELAHWSGEFGVKLSQEQLGLFQTYLRELRAWNRKTNLTAITDPQEIIVKHFLDSLACSKGLVDFSTNLELLDIGSGAGFPGLPLKIAMPELSVTLLEPASKKIAFLRHIVGTLQLKSVKAIPKTLEAFALDHTNHKKFSYVISRALNMSLIIERCLGLLSAEGRLILCRSKPLSETETPGMFEVERELSYDLPCGYGHRVLSILKRP